jgi:hypothetical protein
LTTGESTALETVSKLKCLHDLSGKSVSSVTNPKWRL